MADYPDMTMEDIDTAMATVVELGEPWVVTVAGKPVAVVIRFETYEQLMVDASQESL